MFVGNLLLFAAVIVWATAFLMNPNGTESADGIEHVRRTVALFVRNAAIGTLLLSALAAYMLFPKRRPRMPVRDRAVIIVLAVLTATSLYQLIWAQTDLLA